MMQITVQRFSKNRESTIGLFFINCAFRCYTLEDEHRANKVAGETRIPAGKYRIQFRKIGGFHNKYLSRYGAAWHRGMLEVVGVPNFEYILIHIGNNDDDTAGCLLVANQANNNQIADGFIGDSRKAYEAIYPEIREALLAGEPVWINYKDEGEIDMIASA